MNIVKIYGGLGNQMFQYAFGKALEFKGAEVMYDLEWYTGPKKQIQRPLTLDKFKTTLKDVNIPSVITKHKEIRHSYHTVRGRGYDPNHLLMDGIFFIGYWQYLMYYNSVMSNVCKEFVLKEDFYTDYYLKLKKQISEKESVSLHVRRGDYVKLGFPMPPLKYYFEALEATPGDIYIFSDDIRWCGEKFKPDYFDRKITFVSSESYVDFELMRMCSHNIIAVSTFSWWAAMVNTNQNKIVVAPKKWLVTEDDLHKYNNEIHYPTTWLKI